MLTFQQKPFQAMQSLSSLPLCRPKGFDWCCPSIRGPSSQCHHRRLLHENKSSWWRVPHFDWCLHRSPQASLDVHLIVEAWESTNQGISHFRSIQPWMCQLLLYSNSWELWRITCGIPSTTHYNSASKEVHLAKKLCLACSTIRPQYS